MSFCTFFSKPVQNRITIVKGTCKRFDIIKLMSIYHSYCSINNGATCIVVTTQMLTVQFWKNGSYLHFARIKFSVGTFCKNLRLVVAVLPVKPFWKKTINKQI